MMKTAIKSLKVTSFQNGRSAWKTYLLCFQRDNMIVRMDQTFFSTKQMVRNSVNYKQMAAGYGYPLYYDTLFADLREAFNEALYSARQSSSGYWPTDATMTGVTVRNGSSLSTIDPIWPKLWRRLDEYFIQ